MKRLFFALATLMLFCTRDMNVAARTETEAFVPGSTLEGVCYYLPRTALRVVVKAEKTVTRPGDFAK